MLTNILAAQSRLAQYIVPTPCEKNERLTENTGCTVFLKREDRQSIRSYKVRGALNAMLSSCANHYVCASAGNHAQGVAYGARMLGRHATIVMPINTPQQKVDAVRRHGSNCVEVILYGENYSQACTHAQELCCAQNGQNGTGTRAVFIHPFDDPQVIAGQGTVGLELLGFNLDAILVPIGGGGLAAGICEVYRSAKTQVIGVQMEGACSMYKSLQVGAPVTLEHYDTFVDGAAVASPGKLNFERCREKLSQVVLLNNRDISDALVELYNNDGIIVELAGAMSVAALKKLNIRQQFGKQSRVCCLISGANNDARRMPQILALSSYSYLPGTKNCAHYDASHKGAGSLIQP